MAKGPSTTDQAEIVAATADLQAALAKLGTAIDRLADLDAREAAAMTCPSGPEK